jgi:hypothetical protein
MQATPGRSSAEDGLQRPSIDDDPSFRSLAEREHIQRLLAENGEYKQELERFKNLLPAIGVGPVPRAEARALLNWTIESPLGWPAEICAELARIEEENKALQSTLGDREALQSTQLRK